MEGDRRVDGDRRRAHAALGAVEGEDAAQRRPPDEEVLGREAGQQALDAGDQLGRVEGLDQVVVGARAQALDLRFTSRSAVSMMIGMWRRRLSSARILVATW